MWLGEGVVDQGTGLVAISLCGFFSSSFFCPFIDRKAASLMVLCLKKKSVHVLLGLQPSPSPSCHIPQQSLKSL